MDKPAAHRLCQRFFAQHRQTGPERLDADRPVGGGDGHVDHRVCCHPGQHIGQRSADRDAVYPGALGGSPGHVEVKVDEPDQLCVRRAGYHSEPGFAHQPGADLDQAQRPGPRGVRSLRQPHRGPCAARSARCSRGR